MKVAPDMPDLTATKPERVFSLPHYTGVVLKDVPAVSTRQGRRSTVRYLWVLAVVEPSDDPDEHVAFSPVYTVTLEQAGATSPTLSAFHPDGQHLTYGSAPELVEEDAFIERAMEMLRAHFGPSKMRKSGRSKSGKDDRRE